MSEHDIGSHVEEPALPDEGAVVLAFAYYANSVVVGWIIGDKKKPPYLAFTYLGM